MPDWFPNALGIAAGLLSTSSFVPQVLKAWRERDTHAISRRMYAVTVTAFVLWIAYGFVLGSLPLIVFNLASLVLSGTVLVLTLRKGGGANGRPEPRPRAAG